MIPGFNKLKEIEIVTQPSKCFQMLESTNRIMGLCDGLEAVKQAIYNILNTERYEHIIYSWNYGIELKDLFGRPIDYIISELEDRIKDALLQDDRIESADSFEFEKLSGGKLQVTFVVRTKFGNLQVKKEVTVNV